MANHTNKQPAARRCAMPMGIRFPSATLAATPAANVQDTIGGATMDASPALEGKKYMAKTESTKASVMAPMCIVEVSPNGKTPAVKKSMAAMFSKIR